MSSRGAYGSKSTTSHNICELVATFKLTCEQNGVSAELIINQLLDQLGYESTGRIRPKKHRIELTDDVIKFLKEKETEKANTIAERERKFKARKYKTLRVTDSDKHRAQSLIVSIIMSFDCWRENHRVTRKLVYQLFGYKERTMRHNLDSIKENIIKEGSFENKIYSELCSEILNNFCQ